MKIVASPSPLLLLASIVAALRFILEVGGFFIDHPSVERMKTMDAVSDQVRDSRSSADGGDAAGRNPFRIGYVTDVEGNLPFFRSFVERSGVLDLVDSDPRTGQFELRLRDDSCHFVFGGDAVDRGAGDIRLCRALVSLKRRYPDRVHLLVGNRDLNKLRFSAELGGDDLGRGVDEIPPPHWDPHAPTLREYLETRAGKRGRGESAEDLDGRVERLHYMLRHTLGCPDTFEFRRREVAVLRGLASETDAMPPAIPSDLVTDKEVVDSFLHEACHPEGSLRQYLDHACVVAIIGNTLFAHGAVDKDTARFVPRRDTKFCNPPSRPPPGKICHGVREWAEEMNAYLRDGLADHRARPHWDAARSTRGGEALLALQNRAAMWGRSVVSNCYGDGGCITTAHTAARRSGAVGARDPRAFEGVCSDPADGGVAAWLQGGGIRRVVVGHKPTGDCPAVLSAARTGVEVVSGDTSYSDVAARDNRGRAVPVIEIVGEGPCDNRLEVLGRLCDGVEHRSVFCRLYEKEGLDGSQGDPILGTLLEKGWWVKASTPDGYRLCRGKGRRVEYRTAKVLNDLQAIV